MAREKNICAWLDYVANNASEIYLLGDVFDFWFEYKHAVPKGHVRLLAKFAELTEKGIKIFLFKGNHDMWMFDYLPRECGVEIISDELIVEKNGIKFYLHHGDGLGPGDAFYKFTRSVFRSSWAKWLFARLHPNFGIALGRYLSRRSRISQTGRYEQYLGDDKEFLTQFCKGILEKEFYHYFIMGHRHLSLDMDLGNGSRYINTGEWVNGNSFAVFDGTTLSVKKWNTEL